MTASHIQAKVPEKGGVYELTSFGKDAPLYIGQSDNLRRRLLEHLDDKSPNRYRFKETGFLQNPEKMEEDHLDRYEDRYGQTPPWNTEDPRNGSGWF